MPLSVEKYLIISPVDLLYGLQKPREWSLFSFVDSGWFVLGSGEILHTYDIL